MQTSRSPIRSGWPILAGLLALGFIPVLAGGVRLASLAGGVVTPANARFFAEPAPVVAHVIGASLFAVLGALQFWPGFRRFSPRWHRISGRVTAPAGLVAALAGLWMNQFYPAVPGDDLLLYGFRLVFGLGMVASVVLGVSTILKGRVAAHRAWMMRAYAIGMAAGTQAVTQLPWILAFGMPMGLTRSLLMGGAWVLNLAVAEVLIRKAWPRPVIMGFGRAVPAE